MSTTTTEPLTEPLEELRAALPDGRVLTDPDATARYAHDEAAWAVVGRPLAVVRPRSTAEVQAVVRWCLAHRVPVVPRGAGSGLSGGASATDGCIVLSLEAMDAVLEVDAAERLAVVQPGVVNDDLRARVATDGLWYPPDPASSSWSTIGGNVSTNAGGLCCVKYGVTGDYVLGLQLVNGHGEVVRLGRRTAKGVAGYDLTHLVVGAEGTLGVVTEITLRLRAARAPEATVVGHFASAADAGRAVAAVTAAGVRPSALELLDKHCLRAVDEWKNLGLSSEAEVVLLGRTDVPGPAGDAEAQQMVDCFAAAGASWAARSTDQAEADMLFEARRLAHPALERRGVLLSEDVCVPVAALPEMLERIEAVAQRHDTMIATIAHAGDGNLHPLIITPPGDTAATVRAQRAFEQIMTDALELGGTITGEHGVGTLKMGGLRRELGPEVLAMHRAVKQALDPAGIFNPGKVVQV